MICWMAPPKDWQTLNEGDLYLVCVNRRGQFDIAEVSIDRDEEEEYTYLSGQNDSYVCGEIVAMSRIDLNDLPEIVTGKVGVTKPKKIRVKPTPEAMLEHLLNVETQISKRRTRRVRRKPCSIGTRSTTARARQPRHT
jgi:hypothetical protein